MKQPVYLYNAATSFPKPPQVSEEMIHSIVIKRP